MRSCEDFEILMNLLLDDMLPSEESRPLQEHLKECQACRSRYEQLCAMKEALAAMEEPVPEGLHGQILDYVEKNCPESAPTVSAAPVPFYRKRWYRTLAGVAACAVIAVAAARFMPGMDFVSMDNAAPEMSPQTPVAVAPSESPAPAPTTPAMDLPAPPKTPVQNVANSDTVKPEQGDQEDVIAPTANAVTGQMAEDLPPVRQEYANADNTYRVPSIRKWLKVTGPRDKLPEWVDLHFIYQAELDGASHDYVEIQAWAEEYWIDQLTACGFTVEVLDEHDVAEDGEHILLVFYWE